MEQPPTHLTKEFFRQWRSPRRGSSNPEIMTNDIWTWIIREELDVFRPNDEQFNAYRINETFGGPSSMNAGPCWCFSRFGQSETLLPDGRTVFVAGEHEDFYDPDFHIYNDVVVIEKSGEISIFGYPEDIFPPTDFHSATHVGNDLILIGNLGYSGKRMPGHTQVLRLELDTWHISSIETSGDSPGWIHKHEARLSESGNEILITGGEIDRGDETPLLENIDDWSLDLRSGQWKQLTKRDWPRFYVCRKDQKRNHLWEMRQLQWEKRIPQDVRNQYKLDYNYAKTLKKELGAVPDLNVLEKLYVPGFATEIIERADEDDAFNTYRIRIGDVVVRYVEDSHHILVTVEGKLPEDTIKQLQNDLVEKLSLLERKPIQCVPANQQ